MGYAILVTFKTKPDWRSLNLELITRGDFYVEYFPISASISPNGQTALGISIPSAPSTQARWMHIQSALAYLALRDDCLVTDLYDGKILRIYDLERLRASINHA
jgi:hypothetical protein